MKEKTVVLFKSEKEESRIEPFLKVLEDNGISASIIPTLAFKFINEDVLQRYLQMPEDFGGLIFTSPRAVEAVNRIHINNGVDISKWSEKKNYSVGETTSNVARDALKLDIDGKCSGNSESVSRKIYLDGHNHSCKPLLFPCSNKRKETIPKYLSNHGGGPVTEVIAYETIPNFQMKDSWEKLVAKQGIPNILIFFSPSNVEFSHQMIKETYKNFLPKYIAFGPSTEQALAQYDMSACKTCTKSDPESVLDAVKAVTDD